MNSIGQIERATNGFFTVVQEEGETEFNCCKKCDSSNRGRQIKRVIEYFNLDAIISVGYGVNSERQTGRTMLILN